MRNVSTLLTRAAAFAAALALAGSAAAQLNLPRPSPGASITQTIGVTDVTVVYSRPGVKGRAIWGGLVPYDKPWRTGANASTTIAFTHDVTVEGKKIPAGTYSLYSIPGKTEWTFAFNSDAKAGAGEWDAKKDVARVTVKPMDSAMTEWMSFSFQNLTASSAELALDWDKLRVSLKIEVATSAIALANARDAVSKAKPDDWQTPLRAANWMIENKVEKDEAGKLLDKSIAVKATFSNTSAKARFLADGGKKKEAVAAAQKALEIAKTADPKPDPDAVANLQKQMAEWSAKG